jgi:hypothetical protein
MNDMRSAFILLLGSAICATYAGPDPAAAAEFRFVEGAGYMDLMNGDSAVYRHVTPVYNPSRHDETFKVFHHVNGFHGEGFLTKGAGGDFSHHRGLFLGWFSVKTAGDSMDSWHGAAGASIRHLKYLPERELKGAKARRASVSEWTKKDGSVIVRDTREVTAWFEEAGKLHLDWALTIASASGDSVLLSGDPAHSGFQFRADSVIKAFEYLGPADKSVAGDDWTMKPANSWIMAKFALKGHAYAVMQMDHPLNPRPVIAQKRDYGRFGHFFRATIAKDKPSTFYFRTLVLDVDRFGSPTQAQAQAFYDAYAKSNPVSIGTGRPNLNAKGRPGAEGKPFSGAYNLQGRSLSIGPNAQAAAPAYLILTETPK